MASGECFFIWNILIFRIITYLFTLGHFDDQPPRNEPVLVSLAVEPQRLLATGPLTLLAHGLGGALVDPLDVVGDADVAPPLLLRDVVHRRVEAAEVVDAGARVADEHLAEAVAHAAVLLRRLVPVLRDVVAQRRCQQYLKRRY